MLETSVRIRDMAEPGGMKKDLDSGALHRVSRTCRSTREESEYFGYLVFGCYFRPDEPSLSICDLQ